MTYGEYVASFVGKRGQFIYKEGRYEVIFHADNDDDAVITGDLCEVTGSLGQSIFCETESDLKSTKTSDDCRIITVYDDFVLIECDGQKGSKAIPLEAIMISVQKP